MGGSDAERHPRGGNGRRGGGGRGGGAPGRGRRYLRRGRRPTRRDRAADRHRLADVAQHELESSDLALDLGRRRTARGVLTRQGQLVRLRVDGGETLAQVANDLAERLRELDVRTDGAVEKLLGDGADLRADLARVGRLRPLGLSDHDARGRGRGGCGRLLDDRGEGVGDDLGDGLRVEPFLLQVVLERDGGEHVLHHRRERLHHALAPRGHRGEGLAAPEVQRAVELGPREEALEVLLVVLQDEGDLLRHQAVGEQVDLHVLEGRQVLPCHPLLAVRDEDDRVRSGQHHSPGGVVLDLAGHGVELDLEVVAGDGAEAEGQQVEEERSVLGRVQRDQPVRPLGVADAVDLLEVGGLPGLRRPVVDHLGFDGPLAEVELDHGSGAGTIACRGPA